MTNKSKQKGTGWETAIKDWLAFRGYQAKRIVLHGNKDVGDLELEGMPWLVIEAKNVAKMDLGTWINETQVEKKNADAPVGVVWHHRARKSSPGDAYVTMTGDDFFKMLEMINNPPEDPRVIL